MDAGKKWSTPLSHDKKETIKRHRTERLRYDIRKRLRNYNYIKIQKSVNEMKIKPAESWTLFEGTCSLLLWVGLYQANEKAHLWNVPNKPAHLWWLINKHLLQEYTMFCLRHSKCLASINVLMHDSLLFLSYKPHTTGGEIEAQNEHDPITNHPVTQPGQKLDFLAWVWPLNHRPFGNRWRSGYGTARPDLRNCGDLKHTLNVGEQSQTAFSMDAFHALCLTVIHIPPCVTRNRVYKAQPCLRNQELTACGDSWAWVVKPHELWLK